MNVAGLVVAGGKGERMSRSGATVPKPLVAVRGLPLLEWNLFALLKAGVRDLHVAVSAKAAPVLRFARSHCDKTAKALGARLSVIAEDPPLGSMGAAAFLRDREGVLVVNADNLTSLDLRAISATHQTNGAALTLAVHDQAFPIPFGEVKTEADRVVAYREKPTLVMPICSAVSVLSRAALANLQPGENIGLPAFADRLLSLGADVRAFRHNAPWIDVNDSAAAERAEALLAAHTEEFDLWAGRPDRERLAVIFSSGRGVAFEQIEDGTWSLPMAGIEVDENPLPVVAHIAEERFGVLASPPAPLAVFDGIDTVRGGITRTRVFSLELPDRAETSVARWIRPEDVKALSHAGPVVLRALAAHAGGRTPFLGTSTMQNVASPRTVPPPQATTADRYAPGPNQLVCARIQDVLLHAESCFALAVYPIAYRSLCYAVRQAVSMTIILSSVSPMFSNAWVPPGRLIMQSPEPTSNVSPSTYIRPRPLMIT